MTACEHAGFAEFWESLLQMDADAIAAGFSAGGSLCFGGDRPAQGQTAVRHEFVRLFARTAAIAGCVVSLWARQDVVVADCDISFSFDDGARIAIPITAVCCFSPQGIARCEFSFYPEPVLGRMAA